MTSSLRFLKVGRRKQAARAPELSIPTHFRCPISLDLMRDPVTLCSGITYDRESIETWLLDAGDAATCPVTKQPLKNADLIPNHTLRRMIQDWCVANSAFGIDRIPTPRVPVSAAQAAELLSEISAASSGKDVARVSETVGKISRLCKESERDRRCFAASGAGAALTAAFNAFSAGSVDNHALGLEEILHAMSWMFPLDSESRSHLGSPSTLRALQRLLKNGDLAGRRRAVIALKEVIVANSMAAEDLGLVECLTKVIREPICPVTTKAALVVVFHLVSSSTMAARFVDMGIVALLLEKLADSDRSICEKALGVLDGIFNYEEGREMGYSNALTVPILVKKMFRVSDLATEFAISALWKLCKGYREEEEGRVLLDALQVGAFQKVLLLLQAGCSEKTKEKATELLKMMNFYRGRVECIESADFKQLKRPF